MHFIGVDLAWAEKAKPNESGIVMLDQAGTVVSAGWRVGVDEVLDWLDRHAPPDALLFVDAPLVVNNCKGQRLCEKEVGRSYWSSRVAANSTNLGSRNLAGVTLREALTDRGWRYDDGAAGPPRVPGRVLSECYPYTTIVGADELGYDERPRYKRKPKGMPKPEFRPLRAGECDELIRRVASLKGAEPPMRLDTHSETRRLVTEPSPLKDADYKHREDLLDAAICAWTAALWVRWGKARCQVLGLAEAPRDGMQATIIAPFRPLTKA